MDGDSLAIRLAPGGRRVGLFATMPGEKECRATFQRVAGAR